MSANPTVSCSGPSSFAAFCATHLAAVAVRAADLLATWRQRAADRQQLQGLDNHMLRDVGLSRADVEFEISKPFWRG